MQDNIVNRKLMHIDGMKFHGLHGNPLCDFIKNMLSSTVKKYMRDLVKAYLVY